MQRSNRSTVTRLLVFDIAVLLSAVAVFALFPGRTARLITDFYPLTLAVLCTWLSHQIYRSLERGRQARRIWGLLTAAMAFWTLAEITWALYDFVIRAEPYPSWADLFYMIGDVLLVAFFAVQVRFLRLALQGWKRFLAIGLILTVRDSWWASSCLCAHIRAEPSRDWLEFGVNLLYETRVPAPSDRRDRPDPGRL
jgi:hypothetical protein